MYHCKSIKHLNRIKWQKKKNHLELMEKFEINVKKILEKYGLQTKLGV